MSEVIKEAVDQAMRAVNELRENNEKLLAAKADGKAVSDLQAKVEKIDDALDRYENMNQQLVTAQATTKAQQEQLDKLEAAIQRAALGGVGMGAGNEAEQKAAAKEAQRLFDKLMRTRTENRDPQDTAKLKQYVAALVKGDDTSAGYLLAPPEIERAITKDVIELSPIRQVANVRVIGGPSYKWRRRIGTGSATRVGEIQPRTNSTDPRYGMGEILAPEMIARFEISQQMLEDSDYDLMAELREEVAEQMAVKEGQECINGQGSIAHQMEGLLAAQGIGEAVTGDGTKINADGYMNLYAELKTIYARTAIFLLNRRTLRDTRKLKDNQNQYLWVPGFATATPNTILGASYVEFPDLPDVAANAYPVLFGDFKKGYTLVDRIGLGFQADYITGADDGLVVYRARKRVGGGVKQSECIKKLKISA